MRRLTALILAMPLTAAAVPTEMNHQGRLFDALGIPVDDPTDLTFSLYTTATGGTALWTEDQTGVDVDNGYYTVNLGSNSALDSAIFDGSPLYLGIRVDAGNELAPRPKLVTTSYAFRADYADTADAIAPGADINVNSIQINGTTMLDSSGLAGDVDWSNITNKPADLTDGDADALGSIVGCADGDVAIYGSGSWSCAGTISLDRLAVGTSANTLAFGDHTHSYGFTDIGGVIALTQLPMGTSSNTVAYGDHSHSYGFTDIGGTVALTQLPMSGTGGAGVAYGDHDHGNIQPGDNSATCDSGTSSLWGTLRWTGTTLDVCTAAGWRTLESNAATGSGPGDAGVTCNTLLSDTPALPSGVYWLDPDGDGAAFETWCDMDTDGGGWTLAAYGHVNASATTGSAENIRSLQCGGGTFAPAARANSGAAIDAVSLAQQSTHMAVSMNIAGGAQASGDIEDYQRGYKIAIPSPSDLNFVSHSYVGGNWGSGANQTGACVPTAVEGIQGTSWTGTLYTLRNVMGVSWTDSYPTGYGAMNDSDCLNTSSGVFAPSFHSGHGGGGTYGSHIAECDVTHGSRNYNHRGIWVHDQNDRTGATALWFR